MRLKEAIAERYGKLATKPWFLFAFLVSVAVIVVALWLVYDRFAEDPYATQLPEGRTITDTTPVATTLDAVAQADLERQEWLQALQPGAAALELAYGAHHPGITLGKIVIPKIAVDAPLVQGSYSEDMAAEHRKGAVHWPDSVFPGMPADDEHYYGSNCQISGRLSGSLKPFERLDELLTGDVVILELPYATIRYSVIRSPEVVGENEVIGLMSGENLLYLSASYSKGGSAYRLVAACEIVDVELIQE